MRTIKENKMQIKYGNGLFTTPQMVGNVIFSLNKIKVSGKQDLDLLLGSILMLESVKKALDAEEAERTKREQEALADAIKDEQGG